MAIAGNTTAKLYDFTINGTALPADMINGYFDAATYTPANSTYLFGVQHGTELGREMKMLQAFNVDACVVEHERHHDERFHEDDLPGQPAEPDDHRRARPGRPR